MQFVMHSNLGKNNMSSHVKQSNHRKQGCVMNFLVWNEACNSCIYCFNWFWIIFSSFVDKSWMMDLSLFQNRNYFCLYWSWNQIIQESRKWGLWLAFSCFLTNFPLGDDVDCMACDLSRCCICIFTIHWLHHNFYFRSK